MFCYLWFTAVDLLIPIYSFEFRVRCERVRSYSLCESPSVAMAPQQLALRSILPVVPSDEEEKQLLIDNLTQMGCEGLLAQPWSLRNKDMVRELTEGRSNQ